jgi:hypothetical protein
VGLLGGLSGCHTTAHGVCDCDNSSTGGCLSYGGGGYGTVTSTTPASSLMSSQPATAMPKAEILPKPIESKDK